MSETDIERTKEIQSSSNSPYKETLSDIDSKSNMELEEMMPNPIHYYGIDFADVFPQEATKKWYTDCMECALLRITQILFFDFQDPKKMGLNYLKSKVRRQDIVDFFEKYSDIYSDEIFQKKKEGYQMRKDWAIFLTSRPFFDYKADEKYEVIATWFNMISYFYTFFKYDYQDLKFLPDDFLKPLSREKFEVTSNFELTRKGSDSVFQNVNIYIHINGKCYFKWFIYEYQDFGVRRTGHTEILSHRSQEYL